jgi:hypothetical protein
MEKQICLFQRWQYDSTIQRPISTIEANWSIKSKEIEERRKTIRTEKAYWRNFILSNKYLSETNMSTSASAQTVLTIVKDEFTEVLTEGTLSPSITTFLQLCPLLYIYLSLLPFPNLTYLISLISGHESLIYDSFYLSLTRVYRFDSS